MTEEEAKQRWCPFVRLQVPAGVINRIGRHIWNIVSKNKDSADYRYTCEQDQDCKCIGAGCMAWRWNDPRSMDVPIASDEGHCGLAGGITP